MAPGPAALPLLFLLSGFLPLTWLGNHCSIALGHYLRGLINSSGMVPGGVFFGSLTVVWVVGLFYFLFRTARNVSTLMKLQRIAAPAGPDREFERALAAVCPALEVSLKQLPGLGAPSSWRFRQAAVFIPASFMSRLPDEARYAVYVHELTHIGKRDSLKLVLLSALRGILWFTPIIIHAIKRYRNHLEVACDRAAIRQGGLDRHSYARLLLGEPARVNEFLPGFSGGYRDIAARLQYIFGDKCFLSSGRERVAALSCSLAIFLALLLNPAEVRETLPWGEVSSFTIDEETVTLDVVLQWHGILGSYIIADDLPNQ